jgi:predicted MFS family arabinose efflux permease
VVADAASYLVSAALLLGVRTPAAPGGEPFPEAASDEQRGLLVDWRAGLSLIGRSRALTLLFGAQTLHAVGQGTITANYVVWVQSVLGASALEFGWLATAQGVGSLLAGAALARVPGLRPEAAVPAALAAIGVGLLALAHAPGLPAALAISAVVSLPAVAAAAGTQTLLQVAAPETHRGRVLGAFASAGYLSVLLGQGLGGLAGDRLGPTGAFAAASVLSLGAAALLLLLPRRRIDPAPGGAG